MRTFQNWLESNYECDDLNKSEIEIAREAYNSASKSKVWVVLEEDRGYGSTVAGVFASLAAAQAFMAGPNGSHCFLDYEEGTLVQE